MRLIGRLIGIVLLAAVVTVIVIAFWIQDANRLKPELESLLSDASGYDVSINGDVRWQLWPPLLLNMGDLEARSDEQQITAESVELKMDLSAVWQDIDRWQVSELIVSSATLRDEDRSTAVETLSLSGFAPGRSADFSLNAAFSDSSPEATAAAPLQARAAGKVTYFAATDATRERITLQDTRIVSDLGDGTCDLDMTTAANPPAQPIKVSDDALLPLDLLASYDISGECILDRLPLGSETFNDASIELSNVNDSLDVFLAINDFLDGSLRVEVSVDTAVRPIVWTVDPEILNVDSQRLIDWSEQRLQWVAHIGANSTLTMRGNTEAELVRSVQATSEFDGGKGQLNIEKIKTQLMRLAVLAGEAERIAQWPDIWQYETFTGRWNIEGTEQVLAFALDNMSVNARGSYDYFSDELDMLGNVTIHETEGAATPFKINPLLVGTPIPVRCRGSSADPTCRLDQDAAKQIVARALTTNDESGLRQKLEEKIDENVPEEYRDAARDLLDILGRSLERD